MENWTLRKKILLGYGLVLAFTALVLALAFVTVWNLGSASGAILSENYRSILAADNMTATVERQDSGVLLYLLGYKDEGLRQFRQNQSTFSEWLGRAEDNVTIGGEERVLARVDSAYDAYLAEFGRLVRRDPPVQAAPAIYRDEMLPAFLSVREATTALRDLNQQTMFAASERAKDMAEGALWTVGLAGLIALGAGLIFSFLLSERLARPIRDLQQAAQRIARGNYDVAVPARSSDELGRLGAQFNDMAAELRHFRDLNVEKIVGEQRKSEAIIQSIDDGLVVVDAHFDVLDMNPAAERALGVERAWAEGQPFLKVVGNENLLDYVKETAASGRAPSIDEADSFLSAEEGDEPRHHQVLVTPVHAPSSGEMLGVILLLRDVTELKEMDRLKSEFVATASHELKTPLTSLSMSLGLLEEHAEGAFEERERELLGVAQEDVERLRALVSDLLDLSKIESGRLELEREAVAVGSLFEGAVENFSARAEERSVALRAEVPEALPAVEADANKITWVLNNLLSNALRYTDAGGTIRLQARRSGEAVHCTVEDDGTGIPHAYQAKIFDKFVQVDSERSVGGSGLGLAICKEIVEAHSGRIWVESEPGQGAAFTFTLPVASEAADAQQSTDGAYAADERARDEK